MVDSRAGVSALGDVVEHADPTSKNIVTVVAHVPGHAIAKAAQLKEEAYICYLVLWRFVIPVGFGCLWDLSPYL